MRDNANHANVWREGLGHSQKQLVCTLMRVVGDAKPGQKVEITPGPEQLEAKIVECQPIAGPALNRW